MGTDADRQTAIDKNACTKADTYKTDRHKPNALTNAQGHKSEGLYRCILVYSSTATPPTSHPLGPGPLPYPHPTVTHPVQAQKGREFAASLFLRSGMIVPAPPSTPLLLLLSPSPSPLSQPYSFLPHPCFFQSPLSPASPLFLPLSPLPCLTPVPSTLPASPLFLPLSRLPCHNLVPSTIPCPLPLLPLSPTPCLTPVPSTRPLPYYAPTTPPLHLLCHTHATSIPPSPSSYHAPTPSTLLSPCTAHHPFFPTECNHPLRPKQPYFSPGIYVVPLSSLRLLFSVYLPSSFIFLLLRFPLSFFLSF